MPSNLFVVIFPRKVQAHTVFVTRREKPKSKWGVGALRSPQGVFLQREERNSAQDHSKVGADVLNARKNSASSSGSGGSSDERPADVANGAAKAAAENFNEAKNQKTVRVQLSRPTEELFPEPGETRKSAGAASASTSTSTAGAGAGHAIDPKVTRASWHPPSLSNETPSSGAVNDANSRKLGSSAPGFVAGNAMHPKKQRRNSFQHQHAASNVESSVFETSGSGCSDRTGSSVSCSRESFSGTAAGASGTVSAGKEGDRGSLSKSVQKEQRHEQAAAAENEIGRDEGKEEVEEPEGPLRDVDGSHFPHDTASNNLIVPEETVTPGSKRRLVTEVIGNDDVDVSRPQDMDEGEKVDIEAHVKAVLWEMRKDQLLIGEPTFHISATGKLMTCIFPCDVEDAHLVLTKLESVGVGSECGSVNVLPMEIGRSDITRRRQREKSKIGERDEDRARRQRHSRVTGGKHGDGSTQTGELEKDEENARRANVQFRALASQIRVTQVTEEIRQGTKCHFDYMALLVASSAISAMGLATDNVAVVVAAMLVSPIMGPVLAFTFGTNVRDWSLAKKGFLVETLSLCVCVAVGFVVGIFGVFFLDEDTWPTHEMETRGNPWGLLTGIAIAIPSGMAVALSILSKNVNSLVGVAISASLLPPAVNTGLCLSVALVGPTVVNFHVDAMDYVMIGLISMSLTIVNILSIYVAGVWLFIFKEVAPIKSENSFWSRDMIYARKIQQKLSRTDAEGGEAALNLRKTLLEAAALQGGRNSGEVVGEQGVSSSSAADCRHSERVSSFSPPTTTHHRYWHKDRRRRPTVFDLFPNDLDTGVHELEDITTSNRESERPESGGGIVGLMAKLLDANRRDESSGGGNEERWKTFQNLLSGGTGGGGTFRGGGSLRSLRGGAGGGGGGSGGGSLRVSSSITRGERSAAGSITRGVAKESRTEPT